MTISPEHAAHPVSPIYQAIGVYEDPPAEETWERCPRCHSLPKIWTFDNGRSTACKCGRSECDHWSIHAESILSFVKHNHGSCAGYDDDELRKNWNRYCATGIVTFERPNGGRADGRW